MKIKELNILFKSFKNSKYRYVTKDKKITNLFLQKVKNLHQPLATLFNRDEKKPLFF